LVVAVLALLAIVAGPPLADVMIQATGRKDPQSFVLDEAAGVWIAALRLSGPHIDDLVVAFLLFRLFDIWKPWPVARLERLPGGFGVVYDDVAAGVLALVAGYGLKALLL
ncbi:MAG TPA: phosphatidylglycerophosphatase A, partial [Planctomycetes bacterium]|nr:phosphatidylglycerophosphatase A [Planctomycetota bacterium]